MSKKSRPFCFSPIFPSNLAQISKSGTVLKYARSQLSITVPDFEIWTTISWENWEKRHWGCFRISQNEYILPYNIQFSQLIVGQMSKSGTVLESWECADFKTVPDFETWRFDREIEEKRKGQFFMDTLYDQWPICNNQ